MKLQFDDYDSLLIWSYVETQLPLYTMRFSPNAVPYSTDAELLTHGLFAELIASRDRKAGYRYIKMHYLRWFQALPLL